MSCKPLIDTRLEQLVLEAHAAAVAAAAAAIVHTAAAQALDALPSSSFAATVRWSSTPHNKPVCALSQAGADPETRNNIGKTFQTYLAIGPNPRIMSDGGKRVKQRIIDWLRQHGLPVDPKLQAFQEVPGL